jgi:hypothetical protein
MNRLMCAWSSKSTPQNLVDSITSATTENGSHWIAELLSPFTDREHGEILIGDNFRALIRPKLSGADLVQCSLGNALID